MALFFSNGKENFVNPRGAKYEISYGINIYVKKKFETNKLSPFVSASGSLQSTDHPAFFRIKCLKTQASPNV